MLELAILGLLTEQPLHGYELKKRLNEALGHMWGVSFGSLYPALGRLEKAGAIEVLEDGPADPGDLGPVPPPTGSIGGDRAIAMSSRVARPRAKPSRRTRKAYRITERGTELFHELLAADSGPGTDEDRAFALRVAFCRYLPPAQRMNLLQRRRAYLMEKLSRARRAMSSRASRERGADDPYTRSLIEHGTETTERDLRWVEQLIALEPQPLIEQQGGSTA